MGCCDITAGMLKSRVTIERKERTSDGAGGWSESWVPQRTVGAMVKALSGSERYASDRVEATARYRVTMRYTADLYESDVLVWRGRQHNIRFINNLEMADRWLVIDVDGGVAV